jgi:hypothetical protein
MKERFLAVVDGQIRCLKEELLGEVRLVAARGLLDFQRGSEDLVFAPGATDDLDADVEAFGGFAGAEDGSGPAKEIEKVGVREIEGAGFAVFRRGCGARRANEEVELHHELQGGFAQGCPVHEHVGIFSAGNDAAARHLQEGPMTKNAASVIGLGNDLTRTVGMFCGGKNSPIHAPIRGVNLGPDDSLPVAGFLFQSCGLGLQETSTETRER